MAWDPEDNVTVLFGGSIGVTWVWGVNPPLVVSSISANPSPAEVNESVRFVAGVEGGVAPFRYTWDFGDGNRSNQVTPTHVYSTPGTYVVRLWVNDSRGHGYNSSLSLTVLPGLSLSETVGPNPTDVGLATTFAGVSGGGAPPYLFTWSFGDGSTAIGAQVSHVYGASGNYSSRVNTSDAIGGHRSSSLVVVVNPPLATPIIASSPTAPALGQLVNFTANETGGTLPYAYSWAFGDGGTGGDLRNISHIFTTNGPFTAAVTVTDASGASAVGYLNMTIALNLTMLGNWTAGVAPLAVGFTSHTTGGTPGYTYAWQFGDGSTSDLASPDHTFGSPGYYTSQVTVRDSKGESAVASWTVFVAPGGGGPLKVALSSEPQSIPAGASALVTAAISGGSGGYTLSWTSQGLSCEPAGFVSDRCSATSAGSYQLTLAVTDRAGHSATATVNSQVGVGVSPPPGGFSLLTYPGVLLPVASAAILIAADLAVAWRGSRASVRPPEPDERFAEFRDAIRAPTSNRNAATGSVTGAAAPESGSAGGGSSSTEVDSLSDLR